MGGLLFDGANRHKYVNPMKTVAHALILCAGLACVHGLAADSFTAADRKVLTELAVQVKETNKRIDDVNKRIDDVISTMHMLALLFGGLVAAMIGFAVWDRRTAIFKAKEETIKEVNRAGEIVRVIPALREFAAHNKAFEKILKQYGLM